MIQIENKDIVGDFIIRKGQGVYEIDENGDYKDDCLIPHDTAMISHDYYATANAIGNCNNADYKQELINTYNREVQKHSSKFTGTEYQQENKYDEVEEDIRYWILGKPATKAEIEIYLEERNSIDKSEHKVETLEKIIDSSTTDEDDDDDIDDIQLEDLFSGD